MITQNTSNPSLRISPINNFHHLVRLAAYICDTDIAMINLLEAGGISTKASFGLEENVKNISVANPFIEQTLKEDKYLLIKDLKSDERFKDLSLHDKLQQVRFYLGFNIKSLSGKKVGTICVLDTNPRTICARVIDTLESLAKEIEEKIQHYSLHKKLRNKNAFLKQSTDLTFKIDIENESILDIDGDVKALTGSDANDIVGKKLTWLIADPEFTSAVEELARQEVNSSKQMETFLLQRLCFLDVRMLKEEDAIFVAAKDITTQKMSERGHKKSLKEKQVLLEEIHHRVKNNLALISSLLMIEEFNSNNKQVIDVLGKSQNRVKSMSLIHEVLYQANSYVHVPIKQFLEEYISSIEPRLNTDEKDISMSSKIFADGLNLNQAVPCALIINEMVTNAYEHAFEHSEKGSVEVGLHIEETVFHLTVEDNGVGLAENLNINDVDTVGFMLIRTLVQQLGGEISYENTPGAKFVVSFKKDYNKGSHSSLSNSDIENLIE